MTTSAGRFWTAKVSRNGSATRFRDTDRDHLASGELVSVLDEFEPAPDRLHLYSPSRHLMLPKLRVFINHLGGA